MTRLWNISPLVSPDAPIFPGDEAYALRWTARRGPGCPVNLSAVTMSPHVGAHADAPLHYADGAPAADALDLNAYLRPCRVVHAIGRGALVLPQHLAHALNDLPPRVLVRTCSSAATVWVAAFSAFAPETVRELATFGVRLIGNDTTSIDPADSKSLDSYRAILAADLRVLENLVLDNVPEGDCELIALPLKLPGACASPVRAVLRAL